MAREQGFWTVATLKTRIAQEEMEAKIKRPPNKAIKRGNNHSPRRT
jgi:hypothetical protein